MLCNHSRIKSPHPSPLVETYSLLLWRLYPKRLPRTLGCVGLLRSRSLCWACCRPHSVDVLPCVTIDCSASVLRPQRALNTNAITQGLDQHQASMRSADDRAAVVEPRVDGLLSWMTWRTWGRGNPSLTVWFQRDERIKCAALQGRVWGGTRLALILDQRGRSNAVKSTASYAVVPYCASIKKSTLKSTLKLT